MGMPPSPHQQQQQQYQQQMQMQLRMAQMAQQAQQAQQYMPVSPMHGGGGSGSGGPLRSGAATPKSHGGSGANTPMHPMQRALSSGQQLMQGQQQQPFYSQPGAPLQAPPPGIVLPESLSPGSPAPLRGPGSAPASRVQSAAPLPPHARAGSFGGGGGSGWMEPLPLSPPRAGLHRTGSAGSMGAASLRGSVDLGSTGGSGGSGGSPVRRTSERAGGVSGGSGGGSGFNGSGGGFGGPPSKAPSLAGSRAGSAGRKGSSVGGTGGPPELDEYDNIKVREGLWQGLWQGRIAGRWQGRIAGRHAGKQRAGTHACLVHHCPASSSCP
jgi:hypothetical protein